jgi:hypothetical protein
MSGVESWSSEIVPTGEALARRARVKALWAKIAHFVRDHSPAELGHMLAADPQIADLWLETFMDFAIEAREEAAYWDRLITKIGEARHS